MHNIIKRLMLLPCFDTIIDVRTMAEGSSHRCYKVTTESGSYFAKYFESERKTRINEQYMTVFAAKHKLTPQVLHVSEHWLITNYIEEMPNTDELGLTEKNC